MLHRLCDLMTKHTRGIFPKLFDVHWERQESSESWEKFCRHLLTLRASWRSARAPQGSRNVICLRCVSTTRRHTYPDCRRNSTLLRYNFNCQFSFLAIDFYNFPPARRSSVTLCLRFGKLFRRLVKTTPPLGQEFLRRGNTSSIAG